MTISLDSKCSAVLTEAGAALCTSRRAPDDLTHINAGHVVNGTLRSFMSVFGGYLALNSIPPFENNEITLTETK